MELGCEVKGCVDRQLNLPKIAVLGFDDRLNRVLAVGAGWVGGDQLAPKLNRGFILCGPSGEICLRALDGSKTCEYQTLRPECHALVIQGFINVGIAARDVAVESFDCQDILPDVVID